MAPFLRFTAPPIEPMEVTAAIRREPIAFRDALHLRRRGDGLSVGSDC